MLMLTTPVPQGFNFRSVVDSHGWRSLAPFMWDAEGGVLRRIHQLADGTLLDLFMHPGGITLTPTVERLSATQMIAIEQDIRQMLSMDWDMSAAYAALGQHTRYQWLATACAGRLLVGPTVWEDLAKTLLTTNTTWRQTIAMNARLCQLGDALGDAHAFPTPERIAAMNEDDLQTAIRAGYRTAYLHELAKRIAHGELDVESWRQLPSEAIYQVVLGLKGFGNYAAGTMVRLLGHFDRLAIDTECRAAYKRVTGSETATDQEIKAYYGQFGLHQGLAMWMDIMSD
ncbi:3-methyladenine DNA glycosylase [Phototrophicus methaneseepsis]|uniref:DNA-(apurinic or apyrimidinic site) lyase n=1 Tax=Phototrophicus methaneseepsis TaxID=2710758 RepID=A0A7S8EBJ7_9CHLR|nr:3-methyladenine DNA glycosylase [Phototrophicus methaneseepsis]QPC83943.1 3-methyladenine DNA glycosylase [Phototrophicus methaneseepsis]